MFFNISLYGFPLLSFTIHIIIFLFCQNEQCLATSAATADDDAIKSLPGVNFKLNFEHYSGYLKVLGTKNMHYWFVTSQNNSKEDPLIFWFNGGPGCSSIDGLLKGMGPYVVNKDGQTLRRNEYSWNKHASVVYIETPTGVGYSYDDNGNNEGYNDDITANLNYAAFKEFFKRHPSFQKNEIIISGESYAGVYVPLLTKKILDGMNGKNKFIVNLKGMMIGNGYMDVKMNYDTMVQFGYYHGIVDERQWHEIRVNCCNGNFDTCQLHALQGECKKKVDEIYNFIWSGNKDGPTKTIEKRLNRYDLYRDCVLDPKLSAKVEVMEHTFLPKNMWEKFIKLFEKGKKVDHVVDANNNVNANETNTKLDPPMLVCMNDWDAITYMNKKEVRNALNIPENLTNWEMCSSRRNQDAFYRTQPEYQDMFGVVNEILAKKVATLFYYGDTDMVCNFMMGQKFTEKLGKEMKEEPKKPWFIGNQIGGFETEYDGGHLTFMTVKGIGHMVLEWSPAQAEQVFLKFLQILGKKPKV